MNKNPRNLLEELDHYVFGHIEAKKTIIALINRSYLRFTQKWLKEMHVDHLVSPMKVLLIGKSGTGKTHLVESIRKIVHFPLVRVDATQLLPSGSSSGGVSATKLIQLMKIEAADCARQYPTRYGDSTAALDRMVVFVDEMDKLGTCFESSGNWNKHVQSNFLTLFDNKEDFAGVSFIFAGAFNDITNKKNEKKSPIGFVLNGAQDAVINNEIDDQVVAAGLIPEVVGRMTSIILLDSLTKEDYYSILYTRTLPKKAQDLAAYGVFDVDITEQFAEELIEKAFKSGQGVRYLNREIDKYFLNLEYDAGNNNDYESEITSFIEQWHRDTESV